jgi:acyl-coenzyme A thioesterase PaaI-like protein
MLSTTSSPNTRTLEALQHEMHSGCVVCGQCGPGRLGLKFDVHDDGSVTADFDCRAAYEGYDGMLHGGVISAIADGAMTNCLFAHGIKAVTGELTVRFRHPIELGTPLTVTARIARDASPLFMVEAELVQSGLTKATAKAKFVKIACQLPKSRRKPIPVASEGPVSLS